MDGRLGVIPVISHVLTRRLQALRYQGQASGADSSYRATWSLSGRASPSRPLWRLSATNLKTFNRFPERVSDRFGVIRRQRSDAAADLQLQQQARSKHRQFPAYRQ